MEKMEREIRAAHTNTTRRISEPPVLYHRQPDDSTYDRRRQADGRHELTFGNDLGAPGAGNGMIDVRHPLRVHNLQADRRRHQ